MKKKRTLNIDELIWSVDVARILGISKSTLRERLKKGMYRNMGKVRKPKGFMYSIYDAMSIAHPRATGETVERLITEFREKKRG